MLFQATSLLLRGQYKTRLKTRMIGFVPKVVPRKLKGNNCVLRSEANTGSTWQLRKTDAQRMDQTGRKVQEIRYDPVVGRYVLFKEAKMKGPFLLKAHIGKRVDNFMSAVSAHGSSASTGGEK